MKNKIIFLFIFNLLFSSIIFAQDCKDTFNQAKILFKNGEINKAVKLYQSIIADCTNIDIKYEAMFEIGKCYYYLKDYPKSVVVLDDLISAVTNIDIKTKAIRFKGDVYYFKKQYKKAIEIYNEIVENYKNSK